MSHFRKNQSTSQNGRPAPQVADQPVDRPVLNPDTERELMEDTAVFRAFLKRNLTNPPPPVPSDLLGKILDRIDAVDAESDRTP